MKMDELREVTLDVEHSDDPHLGETGPRVTITVDADVLHLDFGPRYPPGTIGHEVAEELRGVDPGESKELDLPRAVIHSVVAAIVPDPREESPFAKYSTLSITYADSYQVVDAFTLTLSGKAYWVKAARKLLVEKLGMKVTTAG